MVAGGSHIDHTDLLRAGVTARVLGHRVVAPSTVGSFRRALTFGHVRRLDAVIAETIRRAWSAGAGPGSARLVIDIDSTICEVTTFAFRRIISPASSGNYSVVVTVLRRAD